MELPTCVAGGRVAAYKEIALHILFVCTGNVCRSPTAERLAIAYGARSHFRDLRASSAGTHAEIGHPIQLYAARVLEKLGGDASHFAARRLTPATTVDVDLVLTMTRAHRDEVLRLAPQQLHRTFTLREAAWLASEGNARNVADLTTLRSQFPSTERSDTPDPMGHDEAFFEMVGGEIFDLLLPILALCWRG
jgi:protein-tyrosine phosphatase